MTYRNKVTCDAEIGRIGNWHRCNTLAVWAREASSGTILHYCAKHEDRARNPKPEAFRPAPMSEVYSISYDAR